jgi:IclR family transcriptional regulator, pca regulon regulatory protein
MQEWAVSDQQLELHYRGIAVPLRDARGALVGALSVTLPIQNESKEQTAARVMGVLRETATALRNLL